MLLLLVVISAALLALVGWKHLRAYNGEWHFHETFRSSDLMMRRRVNGKWEYREPTESECKDMFEKSAW